MKVLATVFLVLYGMLNMFAGIYEGLTVGELPVVINALLVLIGAALIAGGIALHRGSPGCFRLMILALTAAFCLALYNERILGLGHPTHHLFRAFFTALILVAARRAIRRPPHPA